MSCSAQSLLHEIFVLVTIDDMRVLKLTLYSVLKHVLLISNCRVARFIVIALRRPFASGCVFAPQLCFVFLQSLLHFVVGDPAKSKMYSH